MNKAFNPLVQPAATLAVDHAARSILNPPPGDANPAHAGAQSDLATALDDLRAAEARAALLTKARDIAVIAARRAAAVPALGDTRRQFALLQQRLQAAEADRLHWQQQAHRLAVDNAALRAALLNAEERYLNSEQRYLNLRARLSLLLRRFGTATRLVPRPVRHFARARIVKWSQD